MVENDDEINQRVKVQVFQDTKEKELYAISRSRGHRHDGSQGRRLKGAFITRSRLSGNDMIKTLLSLATIILDADFSDTEARSTKAQTRRAHEKMSDRCQTLYELYFVYQHKI